jgi:predicted DNA-binding transcriptional regulator YafY
MFERDKEDLRDLEIPIETVQIDTFHEDLQGYLVRKDKWQMPAQIFSDKDRVLLNIALSAWQDSQFYSAIDEAVNRVGAITDSPFEKHFQINNQSNALAIILEAKSSGKCVEFTYLSFKSEEEKLRLVAPWRVFLSSGNSYLVGFDQNIGELRTFKIARMTSEVRISDENVLENAPSGFSAANAISQWQNNLAQPIKVHLEVLPGFAGELRLLANDIDLGEDFDTLILMSNDLHELAKSIARNCAGVRVIEPAQLTELVNEFLALVVPNEK